MKKKNDIIVFFVLVTNASDDLIGRYHAIKPICDYMSKLYTFSTYQVSYHTSSFVRTGFEDFDCTLLHLL